MAADVIVLNLWAHDVERADGQAYDVLRSVFEEGVLACSDDDTGGRHPPNGVREAGLPGGPPRFPKVLMLVLRDVEDGKLEALERRAKENVEALWRDVDKPESLRDDASLSKVFDLKTTGLPHFKYQRREFTSKTAALSRAFLDPSYTGFIFRRSSEGRGAEGNTVAENLGGREGEGGGEAAVPLAMIRRRLEGIWACVCTNPRLREIPRRSEQEGAVAVAALAESCLLEARPRCARLLADVEAAAMGTMPLLQFGADAQSIVDGALLSFKRRSFRCQPPISASAALLREKREWLVVALGRELEQAFRTHAQHLRQHFQDRFEDAFSCILGGSPDFEESSRRSAETAKAEFLGATKLAVPSFPTIADTWRLHWEAELVRLDQDIETCVQDRLAEGTWMMPPDPSKLQAGATKKKMSWWKGLALRGAAMYFNYLQATQHIRRAKKASEERERAYPRLPLF